MGRAGIRDRLMAVASGIVAVLVLADLAFSLARPHAPVILDTAPMRLILAGAALACLLVAWRFWSGGSDAPMATGLPGSPAFGRHAAAPVTRARPAGPLFLVPLLALAVIGLDIYERGAVAPPVVAEAPLVVAEAPPAEPVQPAPAVEPPPEAPIADPAPPLASPPPDLVAAPAPPSSSTPPAPAEPPEQIALAPPPPTTVAPAVPPEPPVPSLPEGHRDAVVWLDLSPDGRYMLSASTDHTIKLWDLSGRKLMRTVGEQKDMARTALFLPDGDRALTCGDDGEIVLRDLSDGSILHVFDGHEHGGANKLAMSRDASVAVSGHQTGAVIVWDLKTNTARFVLKGHAWTIAGLAVSPDGTRAVSGDIDGTLKLWDIVSGKLVRSWHGHERGAYGIVFTADGRHLVTGSGDYTIKLWDLEAQTEIRRFDGHSGTVYALALSPDQKHLLSASLDGTARLWDFEAGRELASFDPMTGPIYALAFGPGGEIITGGYDRSIRIWPSAGGEMLALLPGAKH